MNGTLQDYVLLAEKKFERACTRQHFYRVERWPGQPTRIHPMLCKKRTCEECGFYWRWKYQLAVSEKYASLARQGLPPITRAVTLTTAYNCGYEKAHSALRYFWEQVRDYSPDLSYQLGPAKGSKSLPRLRRYNKNDPFTYDPKIYFGPGYGPRYPYRNIQFWGVVEFNQKHTQPHFHFILCKDNYIPMTLIKACWVKAQKMARFEKIAWDTRIEKIKFDVAKYFTKYLTKLGEGKDEIPRRENWKGRFVRYSDHFFDVPLPAILAAYQFGKWINEPGAQRSFCLTTEGMSLEEFTMLCAGAEQELNELVNREWQPSDDKFRAKIVRSNSELFDRETGPPPPERPPYIVARSKAAKASQLHQSTGPIWPCWSATIKRPEGLDLVRGAKMELARDKFLDLLHLIPAPNEMTAPKCKVRVK